MRVLFFGDSIMQGFWDTQGGWGQRIRQQYDQRQIEDMSRDEPLVFNLGVSADTSADICRRFEAETLARNHPPLAFVLSFGVNDACIEAGRPWSSPSIYKENVNQILEQARKYSQQILVVGLTPCVEEKTTPAIWGDFVYKNADIKALDDVLRKVCQRQGLPFVDVWQAFRGRERELLPDGLHPNDTGHQLIADMVRPALDHILAGKHLD